MMNTNNLAVSIIILVHNLKSKEFKVTSVHLIYSRYTGSEPYRTPPAKKYKGSQIFHKASGELRPKISQQ